MNQNIEQIYKNYWRGTTKSREKKSYYEKLYHHVKNRIKIDDDQKILDVAGGNGGLARFFEIKKETILDISDSGLRKAADFGYLILKGDIQNRFPLETASYDIALCFEVLEHLYFPNKTLAEINNVLKEEGILYVGQPNMRADGTHHVRRYSLSELLTDLKKTGFSIEWIDYVPAYSMRDAIISDIRKNRSWIRKIIQCINLSLSFLPWHFCYRLASWIPNRFALIFIVKAVKRLQSYPSHIKSP